MDEIFKSILLISAAGGALALVLLCVKPLTKRLFSPKWQYYIWLTVLIVMVLPVKLSLPAEPVQITPTENTAVQTQQITPAETQQEPPQPGAPEKAAQRPALRIPDIPIDIVRLCGFLWLAVAVLLLGYRMTKYMMFQGAIKKHSASECGLENIPKRLTVRKTELLDAPLIVGLIKPVLYLPQTEIKQDELDYILLHELTHYGRHDLLYKWFAMLVSCVHWFNPFVYIVSRQIDEECEVSCDYEVCKNLSEPQKNDYMAMILDFVQTSVRKKRPLTTQMASSKKTLKRRFTMIKNKKTTSKIISVLSAVVAIAMLSTTVFASGVLSGLTEDNYTIEITNNGEVIELTNKSFIENGEVYLPLRETFEKVGVMDNEKSGINWNNGKMNITVAYDVENAYFTFNNGEGEGAETVTFVFNYGIKIGDTIIKLNPEKNSTLPPTVSTAMVLKNQILLKDDITYVPYNGMVYMLKNWDIEYAVYDKDGNVINTDASSDTINSNETVKVSDSADGIILYCDNEPEFEDPYSDFLTENISRSLNTYNFSDAYSYKYIIHKYNYDNDNVTFQYQIKPDGEDKTYILSILFEKRNNSWVKYDSCLVDPAEATAF